MSLVLLACLALLMGLVVVLQGNLDGLGLLGVGVGIMVVGYLLVDGHLVGGLGILAGLSLIYLTVGGDRIEGRFPFLPWVWIVTSIVALIVYRARAPADPETERLMVLVNQKLDTPDNRKSKEEMERFRHDALRNAEKQDQWQAVSAGSWVIGLLLLPVAGLSGLFGAGGFVRRKAKERAWQYGARSATELRELDRRSPVLHLRSFGDDRLEATSFPDAERLEEIIVNVLSLAGPVVAIGQPEDRLPPVGAARDYFGPEWKNEVLHWIEHAQVIVVVIGTTPGLIWELENLRRVGILDRVIFVVPPLPHSKLTPRWREFAEHAAVFLALPAVIGVDALRTLLFTIDADGQLLSLGADKRTPEAYRLALRFAAAAKLA
jgi:hypothetical protein